MRALAKNVLGLAFVYGILEQFLSPRFQVFPADRYPLAGYFLCLGTLVVGVVGGWWWTRRHPGDDL